MTASATTYDELPVFIPSDGNQLFAVLTRPTTEPNGICAILLLGGVFSLSITRNRLSVKLARRLAARGYHVLRMDLHGVGESSGPLEERRLGSPWVNDLLAAVGWLKGRGLNDVVLFGHCFGGRTCLAATPDVPSLRGVGLIVVPVMDFNHAELAVRHRADLPAGQLVRHAARGSVLRGLFRRKDRKRYWRIIRAKFRRVTTKPDDIHAEQASPRYLGFLNGLVERRVPTLVAFGTEFLARDFELASRGKLGKLLKRGEPSVQVHRYTRMAHGFPNLETQEETLELIEAWLDRIIAPAAPRLAIVPSSADNS